MPSVKIPKKTTDNDMTPFVDVAFLILAFFMLATKFKPPEAVEITTPNSVSSKEIEQKDALMVSMDKDGRVFLTMQVDQAKDAPLAVIKNMNETRNLGLTNEQMAYFAKNPTVGVPLQQLKQFMSLSQEDQNKFRQPGIPIDSANNELQIWVRDALSAYAGQQVSYMIKGDNAAKYPQFKNVLDAFKKNDIFKFQLVTAPEEAPIGSDLYKQREREKSGAK